MEREQMLKDAIAKCFKERKPVTVANVKAQLPDDFWTVFDSGEPMTDAEVFAEIQATYAAAPKRRQLVETTPGREGRKMLDVVLPDENELLGGDPEDDDDESVGNEAAPMPEVEAAPVTAKPKLPPQVRLAAAREREKVLIGELPILHAKVKDCRAALAEAIRAYQDGGPKQTHADLARDFIRASQAEKEARARGETWALRPARERRGTIAPVDSQRIYSQGGNADDFARKQMKTGNRRGAYPKQSLGMVNRDPSRGAVPAPVEAPRPTVPLLAK
jgi:hypothetical protein